METGVKQRLKEFIKTLRISDREFCRRIGTSTSFVNSIRKSVQPDKLKAITDNFPELNPIWLMTGEGEMLSSVESVSTTELSSFLKMQNKDLMEKVESLNREVGDLRRQLAEAKSGYRELNIAAEKSEAKPYDL